MMYLYHCGIIAKAAKVPSGMSRTCSGVLSLPNLYYEKIIDCCSTINNDFDKITAPKVHDIQESQQEHG